MSLRGVSRAHIEIPTAGAATIRDAPKNLKQVTCEARASAVGKLQHYLGSVVCLKVPDGGIAELTWISLTALSGFNDGFRDHFARRTRICRPRKFGARRPDSLPRALKCLAKYAYSLRIEGRLGADKLLDFGYRQLLQSRRGSLPSLRRQCPLVSLAVRSKE
jgi:hypothetical protein